VASHGSLQSTEETSAAASASGPARPTETSEITSFSMRRPVGGHGAVAAQLLRLVT